MKRTIVWILTLTMLVTAVGAFAEDAVTGATNQPGQTQEAQAQSRGGRGQGRQPGMAGRGRDGQTPENQQTPADSQQGPKSGRRSRVKGQAAGEQAAPAAGAATPEQPAVTEVSAAIDFDGMVASGIITQETCDRIKAYVNEHSSSADGLLGELLSAGVITQAEYEAMSGTQSV